MPKLLHHTAHWHRRATEMRSLAERTNEGGAKEQMLRIAADYDQIATRADERSKKPPADGRLDGLRNPVERGQRFQRKADSNPVIADSR
jgi:hypothetical protein